MKIGVLVIRVAAIFAAILSVMNYAEWLGFEFPGHSSPSLLFAVAFMWLSLLIFHRAEEEAGEKKTA